MPGQPERDRTVQQVAEPFGRPRMTGSHDDRGRVDGAGEVRAMVTERDGAVLGVVIVAEGADAVRVRLALAQAAKALLDTELSRIEVIEMRRE